MSGDRPIVGAIVAHERGARKLVRSFRVESMARMRGHLAGNNRSHATGFHQAVVAIDAMSE